MFSQQDPRPMNSQFALRVAVLGGIALVAFVVIFFRLWFLEVLSGEAYLKEANANRVREFTVQAPRGMILDRRGHPLVGTGPRWRCRSSPRSSSPIRRPASAS